jgi:drug/metabolite transporter (DMT)-like permease
LLALLGVGLTVSHSLQSGAVFGDALAVCMTMSLSLMAVAARGNQVPALVMALFVSAAAARVVLPLGTAEGADFSLTARHAYWLAGFGVTTMALALPCYLAGASKVSAGRGMLISALEMPLAPLWVWLAFGEMPASATIVGGFLVATSVACDLKDNTTSPSSTDEAPRCAVGEIVRKVAAETRGPRPVLGAARGTKPPGAWPGSSAG